MDATLLDKEVLCILDTRQIQKFMLYSNTFLDSIGGSDLIMCILQDALAYAATHIDPPLLEEEYDLSNDPDEEQIPWFASDRIKFQLMFYGAGNALCLFRTGALAQKIIRKVSRYYLDHGYSLNISTSVVEKTDNLGNDVFHMYQKLNLIKSSASISDPLGPLPVCIHETNTGLPVIGFDSAGQGYSKASQLRRIKAHERKQILDISELRRSPGPGGRSYLAVIHADGNNLGITIGRILQETADYEKGMRMRRRINANITSIYQQIMDRTVSQLREYWKKNLPGIPFENSFEIIHMAGDDLNLMCSADLAFPFMNAFYENLRGILMWKDEKREIPLYLCMGIAFVTEEFSFHEAFRHAEELCSNAKSFAKLDRNLRNGLAGNWMDFQVYEITGGQDIDLLRSHFYMTAEQISLLMRPYCFDEEVREEPYSWYTFSKRCEALRGMTLSPTDMAYMRVSYIAGKMLSRHWISASLEDGKDFRKELGEPLYEDADHVVHAVWFDVMEANDLSGEGRRAV